MRVTLDRAQLAHALSTVTKAVEARTTIPILGNVLLSTDKGQLSITGTNLDLEISTSLPVLDSQDGTVTVRVSCFWILPSGPQVTLTWKPTAII